MRINTIQTCICEIQQWNVISVCMKSLFFKFYAFHSLDYNAKKYVIMRHPN